jgi:hypothetical protein
LEEYEIKKGRHTLLVIKRYDVTSELIMLGGLELSGFYDALVMWINRSEDNSSRRIDKVNEKFLKKFMCCSNDKFLRLKVALFECGLLDIEKGTKNKNIFIVHEYPEYYTNPKEPVKLNNKFRSWEKYQNELSENRSTQKELSENRLTENQLTENRSTIINKPIIINKKPYNKNGFKNFKEREYDATELEKLLLEKSKSDLNEF